MRSIFLFLFLGSILPSIIGQTHESCATPPVFSEWLRAYQEDPLKMQTARSVQEIVYLPIKFHTLGTNEGEGHYSTLKLLESLCQLNEDFSGSQVQFYLDGEVRKVNKTTYYDHTSFSDGFRMMQSNNRSFTVNVYITNDAPNNACGYWHPSADAIVVRKRCMGAGSHTLTHELGHWLSLPHTFFGWEGKTYDPNAKTPLFHSVSGRDTNYIESVAGKHCQKAADGFCDTPPDYLSEGWSCNTERFSQIVLEDPAGVKFQTDATNYMSYSGDQCQSKFSAMQMDAMISYVDIAKSHFLGRKDLIQDVSTADMVNVYPGVGEAIHYLDIELEWEHQFNATQYLIQISRFSFFGTIEYEFLVDGSNRASIGDLPVDRNFYWRVKPMNPFDVCTNFTDFGKFETYDITAVEEVDEYNSVDIYPTLVPTADPELHIEFNFRDITRTSLELFTLSGQLMQREILTNPSNEIRTYSLADQPAGIYLLKISTARGSLLKKITLQ